MRMFPLEFAQELGKDIFARDRASTQAEFSPDSLGELTQRIEGVSA
jgi:hypothetical protein